MKKGFFKNVIFDAFPILDRIFNREEYSDIGKTGEQATFRAIVHYVGEENVFRNVYLRDKDNKLTEIDLIALGRKGIYVFESKNYSGTVYGNDKYKTWNVYVGKRKYSFLNPIWQNKRHIEVLQYNFPDLDKDRFYNFVIFSVRCKLKITTNFNDYYIIKRDSDDNRDLQVVMKTILKKCRIDIPKEVRKKISITLREAERPNREVVEEHLNRIR